MGGEYLVAWFDGQEPMMSSNDIRPFRVEVPQAELDDLKRRILSTRWPDEETVGDASQGVQLSTMRALADYWASDHDWRTGGRARSSSS